jgi:thiamine-monophosphate kinase
LWVTGQLGGARAALASWLRGAPPPPAARHAFAHPLPRIAAGQALAAAGATAMIDLSDGLGGDAAHLAAASGCALEIDLALVPRHPDVAAAARHEPMPPAHFAALGGEDYELLAAIPPGFGPEEADRIAGETGVPLTRIGRVTAGTGVRLELAGEPVSLKGFDHFG